MAFGEALGSVDLALVAVALAFHLLGLLLRSVAWRNIIRTGSGGAETPLGAVTGGLLAGVGLNGVVPARGGDALKLFLIHRRLPRTNYPMLASSLIAETLFNAAMALLLMIWAWQTERLPSAPELPGQAAFEISWAARHPSVAASAIILLAGVVVVLAVIHRARLKRRWHQIEDGIRILRSPRAYGRSVVTYQAGAWIARVITAWFFLDAFRIEPSVPSALIVVLVQGLGTVLLVTPGGVGPKQALIVVLLAGEAPPSTILAFSAGMEVTIVAFQLAVGILAAAKMSGGFRIRDALAGARRERIESNGSTGPARL